MEHEQLYEELERRYSTQNHPARIKPAFWYFLIIAVFCLLIAWIGFSDARVPANRRPWITGIGCGLGGLFVLLALFAPTSWRRLVAEIGAGAHSMESIVNDECKIFDPKTLWWQLAVTYGFNLPMALFGINFLFGARKVLGGIMLAVAAVSALILFNRTIFRPSSEFADLLKKVLLKRGYSASNKERAHYFFQRSFLKTDSSFEISDYWKKHSEGPLFGWGRYSTTGDSLSTGVFCVTEYPLLSLDPLTFAEVLETVSSVHYDHETGTLFGTFTYEEGSKTSQLAGLPWQYLGSTILCRIDNDLIQSIARKNRDQDSDFMQEIVDSWELITEEFGHEMDRRLAEGGVHTKRKQ